MLSGIFKKRTPSICISLCVYVFVCGWYLCGICEPHNSSMRSTEIEGDIHLHLQVHRLHRIKWFAQTAGKALRIGTSIQTLHPFIYSCSTMLWKAPLDTEPFLPSWGTSPWCQLKRKEVTQCELLSFLEGQRPVYFPLTDFHTFLFLLTPFSSSVPPNCPNCF